MTGVQKCSFMSRVRNINNFFQIRVTLLANLNTCTSSLQSLQTECNK